MIELPDFATMGSCNPTFMDAGATQRGIQSLQRIDEKGSRYMAACSYGPFHPDQGQLMVSRLIRGKQEGVRIPLPLQRSQGSPGAPVTVNEVFTGRTLALTGLTPGYTCQEGYWLSIQKGEQHFLHNVTQGGVANAAGELTVILNEMLRDIFPAGSKVNLARPMIEGLVSEGEFSWQLSVDQMIPIAFTLEEVR